MSKQEAKCSFPEAIALVPVLLAFHFCLYPQSYFQFHSHFIGGARADCGIYIYLLEHYINNWTISVTSNLEGLMFYPYGKTLAYTDNFLLPGLIAVSLNAMGMSLVSIFNALILGASVLNGLSVYVVARLCGSCRLSSGFGAIAFSFSAFFYSQLGHPQLQFAFFIPLSFLVLLRFWQTKNRAWAVMLPAFIGLSFLTSVYYALFAALFAALFFVLTLLVDCRRYSIRDLVWLAVVTIPWLVLLLYLAQSYEAVSQAFGPPSLYEASKYNGKLSSFISTKPQNIVWGDLLNSFGHFESRLFPGFLALFLASIACMKITFLQGAVWTSLGAINQQTFSYRLSRIGLLLGVFGVVCVQLMLPETKPIPEQRDFYAWLQAIPFWLLLGSLMAIVLESRKARGAGLPEQDQIGLMLLWLGVFFTFAMLGVLGGHWESADKPGLFVLLRDYIPGFKAVRAVGRLGIVPLFVITVFASLSLSDFLKWVEKKNVWLSCLLGLSCSFAALLELRNSEFPMQAENPIPAAYSYLASLDEPGAVIALPVPPNADLAHYSVVQTDYLRALQATGRPMVNGYSGKIPAFQWKMGTRLSNFPSSETVFYLGRLVGLKYIVYDARWDPAFDEAKFLERLAELKPQLELLHSGASNTYVFQLSPVLKGNRLELFLPPDTKKQRRLDLTLGLEGSNAQDLEHLVPLDCYTGVWIGPKGQKEKAIESKLIQRNAKPQLISLRIPPSSSAVKAHKLVLKTPNLPHGEVLSVDASRTLLRDGLP